LKTAVEFHALRREFFEMRGFGLATIDAEVAIGAVIGDDEQNVRLSGKCGAAGDDG